MDHESPELIERQMEETRDSLTEKVSLLEQQVVGKLQSATEAVRETAQSVRSAVEDTVACVTGSVKSSVETLTEVVDVNQRVRETPWLMVGGAAATGLLGGLILFRRSSSTANLTAVTPSPGTAAPAVQAVPRTRGWIDELLDMAGTEIKKLAEQAVAIASASLKESIATRIPTLIERLAPPVGDCPRPASTSHHNGNGRPAYTDVQG